MIKTYCIYLLFVLLCAGSTAQNMQILYDFDELPQTLMLNPGSEVNYDRHLGVPFLSNLYFEFGSSNKDISYNSVVAGADGIGEVLNNMYDLGLREKDIFIFNQQIEVFNGGFRLNNPKYYLSFGMYQQIDGFSAYAPDVANLFVNGNDQNGDGIPEAGQLFRLDDLNTVGALVGVFHVGINKKVNERFTAGARLKILSGSLGMETKSNQGDYYLSINPISGPYIHNYENMNTSFNSAGLLNPTNLNTVVGELNELVSDLFFVSGSLGLAMDLGFTYKASDEITVTGSALDLGTLKFNHKLANLVFENKQINSDQPYIPTPGGELDYWQNEFIEGRLPMETSANSYSQLRAPKINGSFRYDMLRKVKQEQRAFRNVRADLASDYLSSAYGFQVYTEFRPQFPLWAITGFYSRELTNYLNTKITYTVDRFSATNIGLGFSVHIKSFNLYATADNLLALPKVRDSNYQSFQIGMNFIFN